MNRTLPHRQGISDWALIPCFNCALLFLTRTLTHHDTVGAWCNCLLPVLATWLFPQSKPESAILLKGTSTEDVKEAERLSHSISPHRFPQLVWDWKRQPWHHKFTVEPPGHHPTLPQSPDCIYEVHKEDTFDVCVCAHLKWKVIVYILYTCFKWMDHHQLIPK